MHTTSKSLMGYHVSSVGGEGWREGRNSIRVSQVAHHLLPLTSPTTRRSWQERFGDVNYDTAMPNGFLLQWSVPPSVFLPQNRVSFPAFHNPPWLLAEGLGLVFFLKSVLINWLTKFICSQFLKGVRLASF